MKILMATPCFYPVKGGTETVVKNLTKGLLKKNVEVDVLTFNMSKKWVPKWKSNELYIEGIKVYQIPGFNWFPLTHSERFTMGVNLVPFRFKQIMSDYDIIHFHEDVSLPLFSYFINKPKIFHLHGMSKSFFEQNIIAKNILKNIADNYITITKIMKQELSELGLSTNIIKCLYNGIDTSLFHPSNKKEENSLLFVGRICPIKGLHILLKALELLDNKVQLNIIGPFDWNQNYSDHIINLIEKINGEGKHKVVYLGPKEQYEIVEWYQKSAITITPSLSEGFGVVNIESLACGTPVVSTTVGGISEGVQNKKNGLLVPPNNSKQLSKAIDYFLDNDSILKSYGQAGIKWVEYNFSNDIIVNDLKNIYENILYKKYI